MRTRPLKPARRSSPKEDQADAIIRGGSRLSIRGTLQASAGSGAGRALGPGLHVVRRVCLSKRAVAGLACLLALLFCSPGCSRKYYRQSADREVAGVIAEKTPAVPNMDTNFTIEPAEPVSLNEMPVVTNAQPFFGPGGDIELGACILSLEAALEIAVKHSRIYQNEKEVLYIDALNLTLARHEWTPIFSSGVSEAVVTSHTVQEGVDDVVKERSVDGVGNFGVDQLLRTGGKLSADFTADFLRFISGDPRWATSSALVGRLSQPLLRGAGYKVAMENLTQAERDLLYTLRNFTIFRKDFAIDIASAYYAVLRNRDAAKNSWRSLESFRLSAERSRALVAEGREKSSELDRLRQAEIETDTRWLNAVRSYRQSLDQFKIQLGLPTDAAVVLDDRELETLKILHPSLTVEEALQVALVTRLDLQTQRERVEDANRKVAVAANALLPQLDLTAAVAVPESSGDAFAPEFKRYRWDAGLNLELPLDRKAERNNYRGAIITYARSARELEGAIDRIKLQINDDWRNLDQAKRTYENSELSVGLNQSRVEEQQLRAELGLGSALDLVDAQNALLGAQNLLTAAVVEHTIARLSFWRDMGILYIKEDGRWQQIDESAH